MVGNYPVKTIKVMGRVLHYVHKCFDRGGMVNPYNFYLLYLDDSSGEGLTMCVKIDQSRVSFTHRQLRNDLLVEVVGTVSFVQDYKRQISGESATIVSKFDDFEAELDWWNTVLEARRLLQRPWKYVPDQRPAEAHSTAEPIFSRKDLANRLAKQNLTLSSLPPEESPKIGFSSFSRYHERDVIDLDQEENSSDNEIESGNEATVLDLEIVELDGLSSSNDLPILLSFRQETLQDYLEVKDVIDLTDD